MVGPMRRCREPRRLGWIGRRGWALPLAPLLLAWSLQDAMAYSYGGAKTPVGNCSGQVDCDISANGQFAGIAIEGDFAVVDPSNVLEVDFVPGNAQARGTAQLHSVHLTFADEGGNLILTATRLYSEGEYPYQIDYSVTDPLLTGIGDLSEVHVDLAIYMSQDQAWIESREGSGALARVYTVPLFFGYGPNSPDTVNVHVDDTDFATVRRLDYYTVDKATLIDAVNKDYAKKDWTFPFLFQGNQLDAASQLAAVDSAEGAAE